MTGMTIGKVAAETGIGIDTIRFYEREGLIPAPARRPSGYREYGKDVLDRLGFIRRAKDLGFSLREIAELLLLKVDEHRSCADVLRVAKSKMAEIDARISELLRVKDALACLAEECTGAGPAGACPLIEALERSDGCRLMEFQPEVIRHKLGDQQ